MDSIKDPVEFIDLKDLKNIINEWIKIMIVAFDYDITKYDKKQLWKRRDDFNIYLEGLLATVKSKLDKRNYKVKMLSPKGEFIRYV